MAVEPSRQAGGAKESARHSNAVKKPNAMAVIARQITNASVCRNGLGPSLVKGAIFKNATLKNMSI
jgi:hypothetical protein